MVTKRKDETREEYLKRQKVANALWYKVNKKSYKTGWYDVNTERCKTVRAEWYKVNKKKCKEANMSWRKVNPERARKLYIKSVTRRKRDLGSIRLCNMSEKGNWIWHHVDKEHVVPVLRYIHEKVRHVCGDGKLEGILG